MQACRKAVTAVTLLFFLTSCASQPESKDLAWYRERAALAPENQIFAMELQRAQLLREQEVLSQVQALLRLKRLDSARIVAQAGREELPASVELTEVATKIDRLIKSQELLSDAIALIQTGEEDRAVGLLEQAIELDSANAEARDLLKRVKRRIIPERTSDPIQLKFEKLDLKSAIEFIANSYAINVIFDDAVKEMPVTMDIETLDFYQAMQVVLQMSKNHYKVIDDRTIMVYPDSKDKRAQYEDLILKAVALEFISAKDMAAILKSVLGIRDVSLNEVTNMLMIRDTPQVMGMVEQLLAINDVPAAQVLLDVEILEINNSQTLQQGVDFSPYRIELKNEPIPLGGSFSGALQENSKLLIPSVALKAFKQNVDAKILANPKIRVLNLQEAKIHIGDRVPLRAASILDATGQTRTTFEYQEIGIKLAVKPLIHPNNDTTLKVALEVSALGENLGTSEEPAYRIGARNAETTMLLADGESVLLGGLIREEERRAFSSVPGISRSSLLAKVFGVDDQSEGRTDVLLTITPRVIRTNRLNEVMQNMEFGTGTQDKLISRVNMPLYRLQVGEPRFETVEAFQDANQLTVVTETVQSGIGETRSMESSVEANDNTTLEASAESGLGAEGLAMTLPEPKMALPEISNDSPVLSVFPDYQKAGVNEKIRLKLQMSDLMNIGRIQSSLLFNPNLLSLESVKPLTPYAMDQPLDNPQAGSNTLQLDVAINPQLKPVKDVAFVEVEFKALQPGTSFIVVKTPLLIDKEGDKQGAVSRNARVTIE